MLRVQNRGRETCLLTAESDDGINFTVSDRIIHFQGIEKIDQPIYHVYDPRITRIGDLYYIVVAMDMDDCCRLGLASTWDFEKFSFMGLLSRDDSRNGVLFPEKVDGQYLLMERLNDTTLEGGVTSGDTIYLSKSDDLKEWKRLSPLFRGRLHYWDERVGSGPPPVKTKEGWLHIYHGIATHFASANIYQTGVVLLDLDNPSIIRARSRYNILEPREMYEMVGQVPNVVFPSGMIVDSYDDDGFAQLDSPVFIYYGAADTSVCLATTTVGKLLKACHTGEKG